MPKTTNKAMWKESLLFLGGGKDRHWEKRRFAHRRVEALAPARGQLAWKREVYVLDEVIYVYRYKLPKRK